MDANCLKIEYQISLAFQLNLVSNVRLFRVILEIGLSFSLFLLNYELQIWLLWLQRKSCPRLKNDAIKKIKFPLNFLFKQNIKEQTKK